MQTKTIYLAGGCFWGVEEVYRAAKGIISTTTGYANSRVKNPTYKQVCAHQTNATEAVEIVYNENEVTLQKIIEQYFGFIDPLSVNKEGGDVGDNYRTGVYYTDTKDLAILEELFEKEEAMYNMKLAVELQPLENFYPAEDYHQNYLLNNPKGYCHIDLEKYKMI